MFEAHNNTRSHTKRPAKQKKQTPDPVFPELVPRKIEPVSAAFGDDNSRHGCQMNLGRAWV